MLFSLLWPGPFIVLAFLAAINVYLFVTLMIAQ